MKFFTSISILLLISLSGCDKRCDTFCGTWESEHYDAYLQIKREGDVYWVSVKEKTDSQSWIAKTPHVMYYNNGILQSEKQAFKKIVYDTNKKGILINDETEHWTKKSETSSL